MRGPGPLLRYLVLRHTTTLLEYITVAALTLAYFVAVMVATNGRALGKIATGIRLIRSDLCPMNVGA